MLIPKTTIIRSPSHRRFIASLPCAICGCAHESQCCHIRAGWLAMATKPGDDLTIPLYWKLHAEQHRLGERVFYNKYGVSIEWAKELAHKLYLVTGNTYAAINLLNKMRPKNDFH